MSWPARTGHGLYRIQIWQDLALGDVRQQLALALGDVRQQLAVALVHLLVHQQYLALGDFRQQLAHALLQLQPLSPTGLLPILGYFYEGKQLLLPLCEFIANSLPLLLPLQSCS